MRHDQLAVFIILDQARQHPAPGAPLVTAGEVFNLRRTQRHLDRHVLVFGSQLRLGSQARDSETPAWYALQVGKIPSKDHFFLGTRLAYIYIFIVAAIGKTAVLLARRAQCRRLPEHN